MNTEEDYDGRDPLDGDVHGLLGSAFGDDMPVLNLVPGAVTGYRRHRRRARVLGTAGTGLAVAGVVAAGTALAGTGSRGAAPEISAAHGSGAGQAAAQANADPKDPLCDGLYHSFSGRPKDGDYTGDNATLERVCASDLAHLREAIPGTHVSPQRETYAHALAVHDIPPGTPAPAGAPENTEWIVPGHYTIEAGGQKSTLTLMVADRQGWGFNGCWPANCPPNLNLADGTPATESPQASAKDGISMLSIRIDAAHWVSFAASGPNAPHSVPGYDFSKAVRTKAFAEAVTYDVHNLNRLD